MNDKADGIMTALARLGSQITTLTDQLGARLERSEAVQGQTRAALVEHTGWMQGTMTEMRHDVAVNIGATDQIRRACDGTREELSTVNETISVLVKRIRLLEADVRRLKGDPRCATEYLLS
ncbi:hypothetical protein [Acidisoma sp.]|uniref:hypothetical protein n=1 Tax=Acidisoma sp. TaxID=1872115 RepID=UPI003B00941B